MMEEDVTIRSYRTEDLDAVSELEGKVFDSNAYPPFFFQQAKDVFGNLFRVAENGEGQVVGYVLGSLQAGTKEGWILSLAVAQEHRRKGIGKMLMETVVNILAQRGATSIFLTMEPDNENARKTYQRLGFHEFGIEKNYFGTGETRVLMQRKLVN